MTGPVVIAGGTGLVGRVLRAHLEAEGQSVVVLSRGPGGRPWSDLPALAREASAIVNLAGENLGTGRWTPARRSRILVSRVEATRRIVDAIQACPPPRPALIQASAVGFYGACGSTPVDEDARNGAGFLAEVCRTWETEALHAQTRIVIFRLGVVLARGGGALPRMALPVRFFAGTGLGPQGISWIHITDLITLMTRAIRDEEWSGIFNACAPEAASSDAFTHELGRVLHRPVWPVPRGFTAAALRMALGEMAEEMLLQGAFVTPKRLLDRGFPFRFPGLQGALKDLIDNR